MGYSFVLFDVSLVISRGYFHCFFIGHTQNMYSPWAKSHFPVGKSSSGTATIVDNPRAKHIMDLSKAFDKVPRNRLLYKLENNVVRGAVLKWVKAFLEDRQ